MLCPVLEPPNEKGHEWGGAGVCPEKENKTDVGSGTQVLGKGAEETGDVYPGEKKAQWRQTDVMAQVGIDDLQHVFQPC